MGKAYPTPVSVMGVWSKDLLFMLSDRVEGYSPTCVFISPFHLLFSKISVSYLLMIAMIGSFEFLNQS